jgi:hypothetical protein
LMSATGVPQSKIREWLETRATIWQRLSQNGHLGSRET